MVKNSDAVEKALRGGLRALRRELPDAADEILDRFRLVVSGASPPASSPGSPPHAETGSYAAGLKADTSGDKIVVHTGSGENNKAVWLEFGTRKMAARPHWRTHLPPIAESVLLARLAEAIARGER